MSTDIRETFYKKLCWHDWQYHYAEGNAFYEGQREAYEISSMMAREPSLQKMYEDFRKYQDSYYEEKRKNPELKFEFNWASY